MLTRSTVPKGFVFAVAIASSAFVAASQEAQPIRATAVANVHVLLPDPEQAGAFYLKYFGAKRDPTGLPTIRIVSNNVLLAIQKRANLRPSAETVIDHIGMAVASIDE